VYHDTLSYYDTTLISLFINCSVTSDFANMICMILAIILLSGLVLDIVLAFASLPMR
jgi:hypothetical protein